MVSEGKYSIAYAYLLLYDEVSRQGGISRLVSDYFYPKVGGVESHIFMLAQMLFKRGHKVVIVTHSHPPDRHSIRYLHPGIRVYHLPIRVIPPYSMQATLPAFFHCFGYLRQIYIRETIQIVHAHVALSALGMEAILHARTMGIKAVFTDHSLLSLSGPGVIWGNKMLKACLSDVEGVICVSHTGKENTVLRASLNPQLVHVIPNAVVASSFLPTRQPIWELPIETVTIVCISRLVYRKGIDLLIAALPRVCEVCPNVRFIVGGDGPKIVELEQMRERQQSLFDDRIELLGAVRHSDVRDVLTRGHIFLNTSLTEAFGIGILEAACCGLFVVSTRVGGVPEVLPPDLIEFAEPCHRSATDLVAAICRSVQHVRTGAHDPQSTHDRVKDMYSWADVAGRTERVYRKAVNSPRPPLIERLRRTYGCGLIFGKVMIILIACDHFLWAFLEWIWPEESIDKAPVFRLDTFEQMFEDATSAL